MIVKLINGSREIIYDRVENIEVTKYLPHSIASELNGDKVGIEIDVCYLDSEGVRQGVVIKLPEHGQIVYTMNDKGDTTDSYRWPPR